MMKVALVYDRINKWGGAERLLLALHELWPDAPLYTAVYEPKRAPWASVFDVRASFLNNLPFARSYHELYPWLTPLAFETFNFDEFDLVISVTSAEAKNIITKPQTLHICYCLTPTRYLWSGYEQYQSSPGMGNLSGLAKAALRAWVPSLRRWDLVGSARPDHYIAISERVADRIKRYYKRQVEAIIYPPVDLKKFQISNFKFQIGKPKQKEYFLVVSRLVGYKRVDIIIDAFNELGLPLVVIGDGWARSELMRRARGNIRFLSHYLTDKEIVGYYQNCRALITAADEDFGLAAMEAMAAGRPVIGFAESGISEIVADKVTGILFEKQTAASLAAAIYSFNKRKFDNEAISASVRQLDVANFKRNMRQTVEALYNRGRTL